MNYKQHYLILLTEHFPFGIREEFLETEIEFAKKRYKSIFIISNSDSLELRNVPENVSFCKVQKGYKEKALALLGVFFNIDFFIESFNSRTNFSRIKYLIRFIYKANLYKYQIKKILKNLDTSNVDLYSYWFNHQAYAISKIPANRKVSRAHRYDLYKYANGLHYQPLKDQILQNISGVYCCSNEGKSYLQAEHSSENIYCSYLGINSTHFKKTNIQHKSKKILLSVSSLIDVKRVDYIINGLAYHKGQFEIEWHHFGTGPSLNKLQRLAKNNLNINFIFHGHVSNSKIYEFYSMNPVTAFINTSSSEGIPVSMMEAISFGIPVIASNVGGVSELVNKKTGILLGSNPTNREIYDAVECIFINEGMIDYEASCKKYWSENFDSEKTYPDFYKKAFNRI